MRVSSTLERGVIYFLFKYTYDFNEYLISGDYVSDFNDFRSFPSKPCDRKNDRRHFV